MPNQFNIQKLTLDIAMNFFCVTFSVLVLFISDHSCDTKAFLAFKMYQFDQKTRSKSFRVSLFAHQSVGHAA